MASPYDRRFVAEFISQLEHRAWPKFPEAKWFVALRVADEQAQYLTPLSTDEPLMSQKVTEPKVDPKILIIALRSWSGAPVTVGGTGMAQRKKKLPWDSRTPRQQ
jgi:hypothetical protein